MHKDCSKDEASQRLDNLIELLHNDMNVCPVKNNTNNIVKLIIRKQKQKPTNFAVLEGPKAKM